MADSELATKVQDMLNEEKWTRATLGNYSTSNLKDLDALIQQAEDEKATEEIKALCDEHLSHSKNSIDALYISGLLTLKNGQIDDSNMVSLIDLFADNKKWSLVEYICNSMLASGENSTALRRLAECYEAENQPDKKFETWERLVRTDYEEADIVREIAENYEAKGDKDKAAQFYKKALSRYINKAVFASIKDTWEKLLSLCPEEIDFFLHSEKKIAKQVSEDKAALLLMDLYKIYKEKGDWDTALNILKVIIEYDDKDPSLRKEVIECYRGKYAKHSMLEDYIRLSNIGQSYRTIPEAMADFEKHIAFDAGNWVFHRTWNVGRIASVKGDEIVIDFAKSRNHKMSLKMAIDTLIVLPRDHIWVLKARLPKDKLHSKILGTVKLADGKDDPESGVEWALRVLIKSYDNHADLKQIKAELVPSVLTVSEWNSWSTEARRILKVQPEFANAPDAIGTYMVRNQEISTEEKIFNQFKSEKNFFVRVQCVRDYIKSSEDRDSEYFQEMMKYFNAFLRSSQQANELVMSSYLFLKELEAQKVYSDPSIKMSFAELFGGIDDPVAVYDGIKDKALRQAYLDDIMQLIPNWADVYTQLFPHCLAPNLILQLKAEGKKGGDGDRQQHMQKLQHMVLDIIENYRDHREAFIWVIANRESPILADVCQGIELSEEKILITLIHIMDISFKEIEGHTNTTENRKVNKQVQAILFGEPKKKTAKSQTASDEKQTGALDNFLSAAPDMETAERVYTLVADVKDLDPAIKMKLRSRILERWPTFKVTGEEEKAVVSRGLFVTAEKYQEKTKERAEIMEIEVPKNQQEIAEALAKGDLRENAEYKAAKEKQDEINAKMARLNDEIERAQIFDKSTVDSTKISFGTIVTLKNLDTKKDETYTILGPWESEPSQNIISYLSPFGKQLLTHKEGDKLSFLIHERSFNYEVKKIGACKF